MIGAVCARRLAVTVRGVVQGVGFRPFAYNAARALGLAGWVVNEADAVRIEVEGNAASVEDFLTALRNAAPRQSRIESIEVEERPVTGAGQGDEASAFQIRTSKTDAAPRPTVPADLATCPECLAEIASPAERRHRYPFTNCTNCGPRWSIIEQLPYDRPRTSMAKFEMCAVCRAEYENPTDRRFHAQPIACPVCGPSLQLLDAQGKEQAAGQAALDGAVKALLAGRIVAMKGLGGFQLLVDATDADAVARLRVRKRRPDRPFALMLCTLDEARQFCQISEQEAEMLLSPEAPIVLLQRRDADGIGSISPIRSPVLGVAPGNPYLGVMLPYTPLHHLLMAAVGRPIVCTSGNISEEPMAITIEDARENLGEVADVFLVHNRPIVRPVDDSIVRQGADGPQVLRRARGYAPRPLRLPLETSHWPTVLAVGGHLKNTVALLLGARQADATVAPHTECEDYVHRHTEREDGNKHVGSVVMSAHIGDLDSVASAEVFRRAIDDLTNFFEVVPEIIACDLHPDYASTRHAEALAKQWGVPLVRVQHHHAHLAACAAEHGLQGKVLGLSWDGTGYGTDGTVWGGEVLVAERGAFRRTAHLRTFALPGGERAMREPRRSALGLLYELFGADAADYAKAWFTPPELETLLSMLARGTQSPRTSSMGRLFDAVAAICGFAPIISFEGQAAMALEYAAGNEESGGYPVKIKACGEEPLLIDWEPLVRRLLQDRAEEVPTATISTRFHQGLAQAAARTARYVSPATELPVVLTGGCFQNERLLEATRASLSAAGFPVYTHRSVPPGDGGIALGQVAVALQAFTAK